MTVKDFDCVEWVRKIRDQEHEANKHLSLREYVEKLTNEVHNSTLYMKVFLDRKRQVVPSSAAKK